MSLRRLYPVVSTSLRKINRSWTLLCLVLLISFAAFDPDQVHQLNQSFRATFPSQLGSILAANFQRPEKIASLPPLS
jgi:hypothetical protein